MSPLRFDIVARADSQALIRALNSFAQLDLSPSRVSAVETGGAIKICIEQPDLGGQQAGIIAKKMRSSFLGASVCVSSGDFLISASEACHELSA
jgi:hypothetical protein